MIRAGLRRQRLLRFGVFLGVVAGLFLVPSDGARAFPWNCQAVTQVPGVGSDGPVTFTFTHSAVSTTIPAFTCAAIDHSVASIPGGVPPQFPFVSGPQGIDAEAILRLAGITPAEQGAVAGMQISCVAGDVNYAAGDKRPFQPVTLNAGQIADTSRAAVFILPNAVPGVSWFVDPTKPDDSGQNWFSCPSGWAISVDTPKAPTLVVPTPVAAPAVVAAGTAAVTFSLPAAVTAAAGAPSFAPPLQYEWDFGDGTPPVSTTTPTATHVFGEGGSFAASVSVVDQGGGYGMSAPVSVTVTPPTLTVATPAVSPATAATTGVVAGMPLTFTTGATLNGAPDPNA
ncbi:MAG: PKD domain-containing protein, partial [Actinobacteria bacterium]|nr:PKD domain-containing protein [Actinomycetota bacterium]